MAIKAAESALPLGGSARNQMTKFSGFTGKRQAAFLAVGGGVLRLPPKLVGQTCRFAILGWE